ncbi:MAG: hypothetical protein D6770_02080 [Anaerolineae bacterium]|nr:MAG: hypothetical protein D6770_02080 [Anaerolineae bacterium]
MGTSSSGIDLAQLFGAVAQSLAAQKEQLNQADTYNRNHGDNMVEIFEAVAQAMRERQNATPAEQLAYASELLRQRQSGSAQVYAQGFAQAAQRFRGEKAVTPENARLLIESLLGVEQQAPAQGGGDVLGSLLGAFTGGGQQGATASEGGDSGLDMGDVLNAGLAFLNAKQQGQSNTEAALRALLSASPLGQSPHRAQSGAVVANTLLQVLSSMTKR